MSDNHDLLNDNDMCSFSGHEAEDMCFNCGDHTLRSCYAPDTTEEVTDKSVWCIKTLDSVQKSSEIRNFCTEFLLFAYLAKIKHFYNTKLPAFVFFAPIWAF